MHSPWSPNTEGSAGSASRARLGGQLDFSPAVPVGGRLWPAGLPQPRPPAMRCVSGEVLRPGFRS